MGLTSIRFSNCSNDYYPSCAMSWQLKKLAAFNWNCRLGFIHLLRHQESTSSHISWVMILLCGWRLIVRLLGWLFYFCDAAASVQIYFKNMTQVTLLMRILTLQNEICNALLDCLFISWHHALTALHRSGKDMNQVRNLIGQFIRISYNIWIKLFYFCLMCLEMKYMKQCVMIYLVIHVKLRR